MVFKRIAQWFVVALVAAAAIPAYAVRYGIPDSGSHPWVGLLVFYNESGVAQWRCTGTLISPTVVLTAAHCAELGGPARIWFDEDVGSVAGYPYSGGDSHTGRAYPYPEWQGGLFLPDTGDAGVVVLDEPVDLDVREWTLPTLAPVGYLDKLATKRGQQNVDFEVVGYGLQAVKPKLSSYKTRLKAWVQLVNLRSSLTDGYNIQTTNSPGKGTGGGGTCFGDSGGSIFSAGQIVAVNSFVMNENCAGSSFGYRVETQDVQDWINSFLQ